MAKRKRPTDIKQYTKQRKLETEQHEPLQKLGVIAGAFYECQDVHLSDNFFKIPCIIYQCCVVKHDEIHVAPSLKKIHCYLHSVRTSMALLNSFCIINNKAVSINYNAFKTVKYIIMPLVWPHELTNFCLKYFHQSQNVTMAAPVTFQHKIIQIIFTFSYINKNIINIISKGLLNFHFCNFMNQIMSLIIRNPFH